MSDQIADSQKRTIMVEVEPGNKLTYPIHLQAGLLTQLGPLLKAAGFAAKALLVTNPTVAKWHLAPAQKSLAAAGIKASVALVPDGENYKTLQSAELLYDAALKAGLDRHSPVLALGGGVIGDLAGFVAATYQRGVSLVQIPTTLLAQVDSSVGGKVAVNHPAGKNMIGAFYQPAFVLIDPETLNTLPARELIAGMAEVIKYGVIWDREFFAYLEAHLPQALSLEPTVIPRVIEQCCKIKALIVGQDEREHGVRTLLNLGHTVGHALESITNYEVYRHGEAVAIGMAAAGYLAEELGWWSSSTNQRMLQLLRRTGLPLLIPGFNSSSLMELIAHDKKSLGNTVRWVLPRELGRAEICPQVPDELVRRVLERMGAKET